MGTFIDTFYIIFLISILAQGILTVYLTLYVWEDPDRLEEIASPKEFKVPHKSFTVLIPAKSEQKVIGKTLLSISKAHYPKHLFKIITICEEKDIQTIQAAKNAIQQFHILNAKILTFNDVPVNKPHGLNKGLFASKEGPNEVIVVFDAEDEVNPEIFNIANTLYLKKKPDIIQAGVQLMNYNSRWFSGLNVLEYYFWFKSRMHFHTKVGMVPLGGNTVFFKTDQLRNIGGWDETCLTEDAEIGIRLSAKGARVLSTYDPIHVTKEETPGSISQFVKQRTRWNQGFIQVLKLGYWKEYDSFLKRLFCFYTLSFPIIQVILLAITPITLFLGIFDKLSIVLALLSFIPLLIVIAQITINGIGMREFITEQKLNHDKSIYFSLILTLLPYQFLLAFSAVRAVFRELSGATNWEKTIHYGIHRDMEKLITLVPQIAKRSFRPLQYEGRSI
jgi:cellulose synthase/poly-beta-1,6-N-acetylglucosamine synthase-like glycosyltransferase